MFSPKSIAVLALAANVVLCAPAWPRSKFPDRTEWESKNLESRYKFRIRHRHLGCSEPGVEGTDFYNQCCVPLPKGQALPDQCSFSCSAASTPVPTTSAPAPTDVYDDDGEGECEDEDEDTGDDDTNLPYCDEVSGDYETVTTQPYQPTPTSPPAPEETQPTEPEPTTAPEPTTTVEPEPATPVEPEPTTTKEPEPATPVEPESTTTKEPESTTPEEPEPTTSNGNNGGNNGGNGEVNSGGYATFYEQNGSLGACGGSNSDGEMIGAIDERRYGADYERSSECGRRVHITNPKNGKSVEITIVDDCPTCENANSIDLSPAAFEQIATREEGMVLIEWYYIS